jgi:hypothetical protein
MDKHLHFDLAIEPLSSGHRARSAAGYRPVGPRAARVDSLPGGLFTTL